MFLQNTLHLDDYKYMYKNHNRSDDINVSKCIQHNMATHIPNILHATSI